MNLAPWMESAHLAPGDAKSLQGDWTDFTLHHIRDTASAGFDMAFGALWSEFGAAGEMEQAAVLERRMAWPAEFRDGVALHYGLALVTRNAEFVAVRDHTVIVLENVPGAVVHTSHNLVAPAWRRSGIAGWMRAMPVASACEFLRGLGRDAAEPVTLVGEMEHFDPANEKTWVRLAAYERAGFKMVDPAAVNYLQPDFRDPVEIDRSGGPRPVPLCLIIRRVGLEVEDAEPGSEVAALVRSLYKMYGMEFREADMKIVWDSMKSYPPAEARIALLPPTTR